jgi:hypothetical protein
VSKSGSGFWKFMIKHPLGFITAGAGIMSAYHLGKNREESIRHNDVMERQNRLYYANQKCNELSSEFNNTSDPE